MCWENCHPVAKLLQPFGELGIEATELNAIISHNCFKKPAGMLKFWLDVLDNVS